MTNNENHVSAVRPTGSDRPARNAGTTRPPARKRQVFDVLRDLAIVRGRYEDARAQAESIIETIELRARLHELRAEASAARTGILQ